MVADLQTVSMLDIVYLAGLFEGEGCVRIHKSGGKERRAHKSYSLHATVRMGDREPLDLAHGHFGGKIYCVTADRLENWRAMYHWSISSRQAAVFLASIRPYVRTLRYQTRIDLGLAFQEQKKGWNQSEEYHERQLEFNAAMGVLNRKGKNTLDAAARVRLLDLVKRVCP